MCAEKFQKLKWEQEKVKNDKEKNWKTNVKTQERCMGLLWQNHFENDINMATGQPCDSMVKSATTQLKQWHLKNKDNKNPPKINFIKWGYNAQWTLPEYSENMIKNKIGCRSHTETSVDYVIHADTVVTYQWRWNLCHYLHKWTKMILNNIKLQQKQEFLWLNSKCVPVRVHVRSLMQNNKTEKRTFAKSLLSIYPYLNIWCQNFILY